MWLDFRRLGIRVVAMFTPGTKVQNSVQFKLTRFTGKCILLLCNTLKKKKKEI